MTALDLLEMIQGYCNYDTVNTIIECNNLLKEFGGDRRTKFAIQFETEVEQFAVANNLCYLCGSELETERSLQYSEYQGKEVAEEIYQHQCSNYSCSYTI